MAQSRIQKRSASLVENAQPQPSVFKLVLLGSSSVGKSSLVLRYVKNEFKSILPTVGCAFFSHLVCLDNATLKFEIWDTAGQEKYHSVCHLYFRGASAALLVYDITKKDSFHKAQQWLRELENEILNDETVIMLVGNKTDLMDEREVTEEEGKEFAESKKLLFLEASAKENHQVTEIFTAIAQELLLKEEQREAKAHQWKNSQVDLSETSGNRKKCCSN
ncbi:ras-related protein Rab-17 [Ornithorhynchus anatinus]|uniref:Ras-related protein Rab-17 n=1 Tax=Ornithorhynchus anatinus TaxID=9258 RepID=F6U0I6_ORNAN|nr:ras-related protein Rab-17 [Ornithorhynchus anatinus]XP_028924321.1 ras-related protein Rab-17 [Ornithorhynchus anatinus]